MAHKPLIILKVKELSMKSLDAKNVTFSTVTGIMWFELYCLFFNFQVSV